MEENPYKSPELFEEERPAAGESQLAPLWRRLVSLPLIIFGVGYMFALPSAIIGLILDGFTFQVALACLLFPIGVALLLLGVRLRQTKTDSR